MNLLLAFLAVFIIVVVIPFPVYFLFTKMAGLKEPENAGEFFKSMLIQKIGTTVGFVFLFYLARAIFADNWLLYSLIWFAMYSITEIGQALGPNYSWKEAFAGIIAEAIYFPLAGLVVLKLLA